MSLVVGVTAGWRSPTLQDRGRSTPRTGLADRWLRGSDCSVSVRPPAVCRTQSPLDPIHQDLEFPTDRFVKVFDEAFVEAVDCDQFHDVGEVFVGAAEIAQAAGELRLDQFRQVQDWQALDCRDGVGIRGIGKDRRLTWARAVSRDDKLHSDARFRSELRGGFRESQPGTLEGGTDPHLIFTADQKIDVDRVATIAVQADRHPSHDRMGDRLSVERSVDLLGGLPE